MRLNYVLCFVWGMIVLFPGRTFAQTLNPSRVSTALEMDILNRPDDFHSVSILLSDHVDAHALHQNFRKNHTPLNLRAEQTITLLKAKARQTQPALLATLNASSDVEPGSVAAYWITNVIFINAKSSLIAELSNRTDIEWIDKNYELELDSYEASPAPAQFSFPGGREPGLTAINAPAMWAMGYTGYGRTAMTYDTGVDPAHPGLKDRYRGNFFPTDWSWYDLSSPGSPPADCDDHGSHTTGTMVGRNPATNDTFGVAINGLWMGCPGICGSLNQNTATANFQWAINPDGDSSTVADMPDVINNSWFFNSLSGQAECFSFFRPLLSGMEAAGIAIVFSAGNNGPGIATITPPKNINTDTVDVFSVANVNAANPNFNVNNSSSRGPSICLADSGGSLEIKPEVSAPGTAVRSSIRNGGYANLSGTSMAAPHVSGAILLLKEAFPYLSGTDLKLALYYTAQDLGPAGEDNDYGMGLIDVFAAYNYLVAKGNTPVDLSLYPNVTVSDAGLSSGLLCGLTGAPSVMLENKGTQILTSAELDFSYSDGTSGTYTWTGTLMPGQATQVSFPTQTFSVGLVEMEVNISKLNGAEDYYFYDNKVTGSFVAVEELLPATTDANVCIGASGLLTAAISDTLSTIVWYDAPTGGNVVGEGPLFLSPTVTGNTTYYVGTVSTTTLGPKDNTYAPGIFFQSDQVYLEFDATLPFTLKSVVIYANSNNLRMIELTDKNGVQLAKLNVFASIGPNIIPLNFQVPAGKGHRLKLASGSPSDLFVNISSAGYPFNFKGLITINTASNPLTYPYFYNWEIEIANPCPRVPAEILTSSGNVIADFTADQTLVDLAQNATVEFTDMSTGATAWSWDFGDGNTSTDQNPSNQYYFAGTYTVSLLTSGADSCQASAIQEIVVEGTYPYNVSIDDRLADIGQVIIFPNPGSGQYFIDLDLKASTKIAVEVYDVLGKKLVSFPEKEYLKDRIPLNMRSFDNGVYYVVFYLEAQTVLRKLMKNP
ncbi:MAG: S8 family serine peptidase [Bacteroidia bacterium]|nr:S8 family serine peptidase [Bacteroidia bacterium]